ncbi:MULTISPECIES: YfjI family protein [Enterobacter cloacae complex]|uniref:YfjI family protein n=1 Tax=Enterobacter cloacae complex TaxID=354276 RepID=UPI00064ADD2F|nr:MULTISPECIES: YfjI family protein [Enterobacter cloacae complex]KLR44927.1 hypothetical protein ABF56_05265 [Enterobacter hormaechei subsp. steigerwaltii]KZP48685.1 hypothetical protein A3N38_03325 [Enterobacter hormaechei subsp. steigerwaltii]MBE4888034.1 DUF3987 domain-containing protein [Enterobacter cloacae complex sp. P45RS]
MLIGRPFPVQVLPLIIRNAVYEVTQNTQAPSALVAASALGAISLACQNGIDVCRFNHLRSPVSLFLLTLADSGERKSSVDKALMKPLYDLEEQRFIQYMRDYAVWENNMQVFNAQKKALTSKMKSEIRCNKNASATEAQLKAFLETRPAEPVRFKLMFNDATPAAIKDFLCGQWRAIGMMSDEGGTIFSSHTINELPFVNKMWDGAILSVERKCNPERLIKDARVTLSVMLQPVIFKAYQERKGDMAKGVGFFARCLICQPDSTQGYRQISSPVTSSEHLPVFHKRLMEIITENLVRHDENERECLVFCSEAEQRMIEFYNKVESEMGMFGCLSDFKDYASKVAENMARMAALLHYFEGRGGDISLIAVDAAIQIISWYVDEYLRLFSQHQKLTLVGTEANELYSWIKEYCIRNMIPYLRKNTILQYGPNRFRNRARVNELLSTLYSQRKILAEKRGKTIFIQPVETTDLV